MQNKLKMQIYHAIYIVSDSVFKYVIKYIAIYKIQVSCML